MKLAGRWSDRNLTKLELVISLLLIAVLIGAFARHTLKMFALAEQTSVFLTVNNINTALNYQAALLVMRPPAGGVPDLERLNPMTLMGTARIAADATGQELTEQVRQDRALASPSGYLGELEDPDPDSIEGGRWYYDLTAGLLVYRVQNSEFFHSILPGAPRLRFAVAVDYEDRDGDGRFDAARDEYRGIHLRSVDRYEWDID